MVQVAPSRCAFAPPRKAVCTINPSLWRHAVKSRVGDSRLHNLGWQEGHPAISLWTADLTFSLPGRGSGGDDSPMPKSPLRRLRHQQFGKFVAIYAETYPCAERMVGDTHGASPSPRFLQVWVEFWESNSSGPKGLGVGPSLTSTSRRFACPQWATKPAPAFFMKRCREIGLLSPHVHEARTVSSYSLAMRPAIRQPRLKNSPFYRRKKLVNFCYSLTNMNL